MTLWSVINRNMGIHLVSCYFFLSLSKSRTTVVLFGGYVNALTTSETVQLVLLSLREGYIHMFPDTSTWTTIQRDGYVTSKMSAVTQREEIRLLSPGWGPLYSHGEVARLGSTASCTWMSGSSPGSPRQPQTLWTTRGLRGHVHIIRLAAFCLYLFSPSNWLLFQKESLKNIFTLLTVT